MIDLARPALHTDGLTLFADHASPNRFHFIPDRPHLRLRDDGSPDLSLLKYELDSELRGVVGAGLLSLTVSLSVDETRLSDLRAKLARHFGLTGRPEIGPVVADEGTCELVLIDASSKKPDEGTPPETPDAPEGAPKPPAEPEGGLVARILGASSPSLYGDNAATFLAVLSTDGAALVEGALRGGGLPAGVVYTLKTTALRPALRARLVASWEEIYDYYENRLHGGKLLAAVDIGATIEDLRRREAIKVTVDELVPPDEQTKTLEEALSRMQDYVVEKLFKPTLGEPSPPADPEGDLLATVGTALKDVLGLFTLTYSLRDVDRTELRTLTYDLSAARAERLTLAPQGSLALLLKRPEGEPPIDLRKHITSVAPGPSPELRFDIGAAIDLAKEGIDRLEVELRYGGAEAHLVLDAAAPRKPQVFWFRPEAGLAIEFRFTAHFIPEAAGGASSVVSPLKTTEARVLRLDPRGLYRRRVVTAVAEGVPFDRFPRVLVDVRVEAPGDGLSLLETLDLSADEREASLSFRVLGDGPVRMQRRVRYIGAEGAELPSEFAPLEAGVLVVGDPFPEVLDIELLGSARFGTEVSRIVVELRPHAALEQVATRVLTREAPFATFSLKLTDPKERAYDYRVTVHTTRGEVREGKWLESRSPKLIVGEGIERLRTIELMLIGPPPAASGLLGIKVRFAFEDPESGLFAENEQLVQDTSKPIAWTYPVASAERQAYSYALTLVHADGTLERREAVTTSDLLAIASIR